MDIFCFFFFCYGVELVCSTFYQKSLYNIINELGVYGKGGINKFDDLFSVIRKKYLSWLAQ